MSSRTVRFGGDSSPSGGSRGSSGSNRHSDSGVGSFSDQASRAGGGAAHPDRVFTAKDLETQRNDIRALQDALEDARKNASHYKKKAERIDAELTQTRKDLREKEAQWRGLFERSEQLEDENKKLLLERRELHKTNQNLAHDNEDLKRKYQAIKETYVNQQQQPPMTSTMPPPPPPEPKLHRSSSKRDKVDSDKKRLSKRFERGEEPGSDSSGGSQPPMTARPARRRRDSYVEPWGPGGPAPPMQQRPIPAPVPPSPSRTRHLDGYVATTQQNAPVTSHHHAPTYSNVPRSAGLPPMQRPSVSIPDPTGEYYEYEDGNYHAYPLPERPRR